MTPAEIHALETEVLAVASWSLGLGCGSGASVDAEGVAGHGPATPLDVVVRELIRQPRPGASEGGAS